MYLKNFQLSKLRKPVLSGLTTSARWRTQQLSRISQLLQDNEGKILAVLAEDLGKPKTEGFFEIVALEQELKIAKHSLKQWMNPQSINVPLFLKPGEAILRPEPLGCVLIIGPWNYPFSLVIQPLISALAAGNTAVLKPSEQATATSKLIAALIPQYFPENIVQVIEGDGKVAAALSHEPFDHIFFTGGGEIGKKIMAAASKNLTPVTLELGGKSPAIVIQNADLTITARRLIWGKGLNAGQTCIAPDHLLVEEKVKVSLIQKMKIIREEFYGKKPLESNDLAKIINTEKFNRIKSLLESAKANGQIIFGGEISEKKRLIAPTLIEVNEMNDPLMQQEIFGPLMPVITIKNLDQAIERVANNPKPLAIYLFGGSRSQQNSILEKTSSGTVCFNDVVMQVGIPNLPFGGVGGSGMGKYHGKAGFETFSNQRSIFKRPFWMDLKFRYPPYKINLTSIKKLLN